MSINKIIVLDDDPTGSQTVHSCLLLTCFDKDTLKKALLDKSPIFFILTNTRGMDKQEAVDITRVVCQNIKIALEELKNEKIIINPIMVSRSDSTLRGHYPIETDVISQELGSFDAHFLIPAFFEGGRITIDSMHYLIADGKKIPVHETEFAKDSVFGFSTAFLPDYVEEKTNGKIKSNEVVRFLLEDVRNDSLEKLEKLENNTCCVVDAENQNDLNNFANKLGILASKGKKFLFRSGASILTALANLEKQAVLPEDMNKYVLNNKAGIALIGSHVKKTTTQLNELLKLPSIKAIEVDVEKIEANPNELLNDLIIQINKAHNENWNIAIYTSRVEKVFKNKKERLDFGIQVSNFLMEIVQNLPKTIGFLISKGGITSNDVLSKGLKLQTSYVLGQILAGCSVVKCPDSHKQFPNLPVVIFPGNVGDDYALATVLKRLSNI